MIDYMNFPLILVIATFVTGIIWLIDALAFAPRRRARADGDDTVEPLLTEYARSFFPVLAIVLLLRSFIFEPFQIPSGSMIPTLLVGDFILVNKYSYGVRLPVIHTRILETGLPERGDVAVFRFPRNPKQDFIKRVIGLPGDHVEYREKTFFINGEALKISGKEPYAIPGSDANEIAIKRQESLGDVDHDILVGDTGMAGNGAWDVPPGHYFMAGDNRDNSNDSRYWRFVPEANLVGKATYIWMHWHKGIKWDRLGNKIE